MFRTFIAAVTFAVLALPASAVTFQHVCTSLEACANDPDFSFTITLADNFVSANGSYYTIDDGGAAVLGWTGTSSVGDGISMSGGYADILNARYGLVFSFNSNAVLSGITELGDGASFLFQEGGKEDFGFMRKVDFSLFMTL